MDSFDLRKIIKDFKIKDDKIIQTLGTNETKVYENTKANLTKTINASKKQLESLLQGEKHAKFNSKVFKVVMPFFLVSLVFAFLFAFFSALKTDIFSVVLASLITVLATTLFLISKEYNSVNNAKLEELTKILKQTKDLTKKIDKYEDNDGKH